jgi:hypothetical protein
MKYIDIAHNTIEAYDIGINRIIKKTLRSIWDENAIGWHEQWENVELAGIYASCEGIVLLSQFGEKDITKRVYLLNLCRAFDKDYAIDENENIGIIQERQRDKALNVSYKLSKFLLATLYIDPTDRDNRIVEDILFRLSSLFDFDKSQFKVTSSSEYVSILSTVTAFIAIKEFISNDNPIIVSIKSMFERVLAMGTSNTNIDSVILTLWAISESIEYFDEKVLNRATQLLKEIITCRNIPRNAIITDRFPIPSLDLRDHYSINKHLILFYSACNFIHSSWLKFEYTKFLIPDIQRINSVVKSKEAYGDDVEPFNVMFWENYHALLLLKKFYKLVIETNLKEEAFMIVTPKFFPDINLTVQDDLAVVIMPFMIDWSSDVYEVFKEAVGVFSTWRSDEEYTDDVIIQTVWEKINQAKFIIADCTGKNPNVFYELGIAHTLGKPVFMCSQDANDFPFDIKHIRRYVYGLKPGEIKKLKIDISNFIASL